MSNFFRKAYNVNLPKSKRESEEFGGGKKGLVLCKKCTSAYYKKSWHHDIAGLKNYEKDWPVHFTVCPACQMIHNKQNEGRIKIKNIHVVSEDRLDDLIRGFCHRAFERDPLDRLINLEKSLPAHAYRQAGGRQDGSDWTVTTTENQLANKIAKKIKKAFSKVKSKTKFAGDPSDVVEITIEFS